MSAIQKQLCVASQRAAAGMVMGAGLPALSDQLTIWPEYNGLVKDDLEATHGDILDDATDFAWAEMLALLLDGIARRYALSYVAYSYAPPGLLSGILLGREGTWRLQRPADLSVAYIDRRQHAGHDQTIFLACTAEQLAQLPERYDPIQGTLPAAELIMILGIEEAVVDIYLAEQQEVVIQLLAEAAERYQHQLVSDKVFRSHWITANPQLERLDDE